MTEGNQSGLAPGVPRRKYVRAVGPRLRWLLLAVFALIAVLGANSAYLASITFLEWLQGLSYQNYFYQLMFLAHLVLGLLLVVPFLVFGVDPHPERRQPAEPPRGAGGLPAVRRQPGRAALRRGPDARRRLRAARTRRCGRPPTGRTW